MHFGRHSTGLSPHPLFVFGAVLAIAGVGLGLSRILDVGVIEQVLDAQKQLLDGDSRSPILLLVQQGQTHRAGGVHIGVEQGRHELDLGRRGREIVLEDHLSAIHAVLPRGAFLARDAVLPKHEIQRPIGVLGGTGDESEGVVLSPRLALFG